MASSWRDLDLTTREREYSPSSCIGGNYQPFVQAYTDRSRMARTATPGRLNLQYGRKPRQHLDLFLPPSAAAGAAPPPLLVFIHGGYWQELSKDDSAFAATDCLKQGFAFTALDYTLAPHASVAQIVDECRSGLNWLHANAQALGFDAQRIVVAGSSAGAHLAAMTALPGSGAAQVRAAVLVSGIFELEPLIGTSINAALGLTPEAAREASPALRDVTGFPPCIVCWGEVETSEFKRQSRDFAARLDDAGTPCQVFEVPRRNHFDVILDLADPQTQLGRAVTELIRSLY
jgi:arylformamidase